MSSYVTKHLDDRGCVCAVLEQMKKSGAVKHFQVEDIPQSTSYCIIRRFECGPPWDDKPRKGGSSKLNKRKQQNLKDSVENLVGISQRKLALKFNMPQASIHRNLC